MELIEEAHTAGARLKPVARIGARRLLQAALEAEIDAHISKYEERLDEHGRRTVVRNGHAPTRSVLTGVGPEEISRPRVDERAASKRDPEHQRFSSSGASPHS